jgi:opacity protein-like surface antigen
MTRRSAVRAAALAGACLASPAASAGEIQLALLGGYASLSEAKDSAGAVFSGSNGGASFGAEAGYGFDLGVFVAASARYFKKDGERVFVAGPDQPVFGLGHPLSMRLVPVTLTIGYRFLRSSPVSPYLGLGLGLASYREQSTVGGLAETESRSKLERHLSAGVCFRRGALGFAVEGTYSRIPDTIGLGGVSAIYGEDDVGGLSVYGKVIYTLGD